LSVGTTETQNMIFANGLQSMTKWVNLRSVKANLQYMSNEDEQREFGTVTNSIIIIRVDSFAHKDIINSIQNKDGIYLKEPKHINDVIMPESDEEPPAYFHEYPDPDYIVLSKKGGYVSPHDGLRNPITIKARLNEGKPK